MSFSLGTAEESSYTEVMALLKEENQKYDKLNNSNDKKPSMEKGSQEVKIDTIINSSSHEIGKSKLLYLNSLSRTKSIKSLL